MLYWEYSGKWNSHQVAWFSLFYTILVPLYPSWRLQHSKVQVLFEVESSKPYFTSTSCVSLMIRLLNFQKNWTTSGRSTATPSSRQSARKWRIWWGATSLARSTSTCSVDSVCTDSCWHSACRRREDVMTPAGTSSCDIT